MDRLSDAEQHLRDVANTTVKSLVEQLKAHQITPEAYIHVLQEKERIHRLQADQASSPIYAEALMLASTQLQSFEQILEQFKILYKSRAQSSHAQTLSSRILLQFLQEKNATVEPQLMLKPLEIIAELLKGAIHVEDIYITVQIMRMTCLQTLNHNVEASTLAEQLPTDTAVTLPLKTRLEFIFKQFGVVNSQHNNIKSILTFQKYNDDLVNKQDNRLELLQLRSDILLEMSTVYFAMRDLKKLTQCYLKAGLSLKELKNGGERELEQALVCAFSCQDWTSVSQVIQAGVENQLQIICKSNEIQNIAVLNHINAYQLEQELKRGFIHFQLTKITKTFRRTSFSRIEELLGVKIDEIEQLIAENEFDVEIDREAREIEFKVEEKRSIQERVRELLKGVVDVGYAIYAQ
ncbi:Conserved_hypothetical protein [Hexamita inflata]|uniref:PCI domain-containing protein n=1 Tax=Hexamita inflata TaxID=28002 RepID=A0AA86P1X1_9EUKA|nr:Conserved hypothetical protein [Hexamita inflata]